MTRPGPSNHFRPYSVIILARAQAFGRIACHGPSPFPPRTWCLCPVPDWEHWRHCHSVTWTLLQCFVPPALSLQIAGHPHGPDATKTQPVQHGEVTTYFLTRGIKKPSLSSKAERSSHRMAGTATGGWPYPGRRRGGEDVRTHPLGKNTACFMQKWTWQAWPTLWMALVQQTGNSVAAPDKLKMGQAFVGLWKWLAWNMSLCLT